MGWNAPNKQIHNWHKFIKAENPLLTTAKYIATSVRVAFDIKKDVWMGLTKSPADMKVSQSERFWHKAGSEEIFCLPNRNHGDTLEGKK